jgi:hypothetical protein
VSDRVAGVAGVEAWANAFGVPWVVSVHDGHAAVIERHSQFGEGKAAPSCVVVHHLVDQRPGLAPSPPMLAELLSGRYVLDPPLLP